jgi:hypothetical protein
MVSDWERDADSQLLTTTVSTPRGLRKGLDLGRDADLPLVMTTGLILKELGKGSDLAISWGLCFFLANWKWHPPT